MNLVSHPLPPDNVWVFDVLYNTGSLGGELLKPLTFREGDRGLIPVIRTPAKSECQQPAPAQQAPPSRPNPRGLCCGSPTSPMVSSKLPVSFSLPPRLRRLFDGCSSVTAGRPVLLLTFHRLCFRAQVSSCKQLLNGYSLDHPQNFFLTRHFFASTHILTCAYTQSFYIKIIHS